MMTINQTVTRTAAALFVVVGMTAVPALAQTTPPATTPAGPAMMQQAAPKHENALESRISSLHDQLKITADQEKKWQAVTKVMRSNAEASHALVMEKRKDEASLTAVADLNAYADIAEAHAKHVRKLAKVFAELYDSMNADQKKVADDVFREHKQKSSVEANPASGQ
ncbi:MAG TPA: Spy/CpxP family protein refolding chaperone [Magnetospirillaceae bacterium]|nr:Spy/CpxP family protein refolding chaperone [Magnetospirillaceae bacterium]